MPKVRLLASLIIVGLLTALYALTQVANSLTVALSYLLVVLAVAAGWGLLPATCASVAATVCLNYFFLPPVDTFRIADSQNWVALAAFLTVGIVASRLSERVRQQARHAEASRLETERLYTLSRMILLHLGDSALTAREAAVQIARIFEVEGVVLYDYTGDRTFQAGTAELSIPRDRLQEVAASNAPLHMDEQRIRILPVSLGGKVLGSLAILGTALSDAALHAVANLVATALESSRDQELARRAEAVRQSEEFKSTLLDALAHQLKTPLTSIKASVTGLLAREDTGNPGDHELLAVINEESERLQRLVEESIHMARIEAGKLRLELRAASVRPLIEKTLHDLQPDLRSMKVDLEIESHIPMVRVDTELFGMVLAHLLDNAVKYATPGSPVFIRAGRQGGHVQLSVEDEGPGIPEEEQEKIFEKYYRCRGPRDAVPGLGMGLAIARDIVIAHGGRMWLESVPGQGSKFHFTVPAAGEGELP